MWESTPPLARVGRIRSLTEARRHRGGRAWSYICCARRASEPMERCSSPCLRASVRELLIERSTTTEAESTSARQTESERSSDAVCGTDDVSRRLRRERFRGLASAERVMWESTPPLARVGRIRSLTEARRHRGGGAWSYICCARRASEPMERCSSPCLRASVRELLIERSTTTEAESTSARQTESERSSDAVCGTGGVSRRLRRERFRGLRPRAPMPSGAQRSFPFLPRGNPSAPAAPKAAAASSRRSKVFSLSPGEKEKRATARSASQ